MRSVEPRAVATPHVYVFNHIPRTSGGALLHALEQAVPLVNDYPPAKSSDLDHWLKTPVDLESLPNGTFLAGHFTATGALLHERYPAVFDRSRYRLITFVRSPASWCASHLRYFGHDDTRAALNAGRTHGGVFARILDADRHVPQRSLDAYWFVGLSEQVQSHADHLFTALGLTPAPLAEQNRSQPGTASDEEARLVFDYLLEATADTQLYRDASLSPQIRPDEFGHAKT
jgi:hypothetical protein